MNMSRVTEMFREMAEAQLNEEGIPTICVYRDRSGEIHGEILECQYGQAINRCAVLKAEGATEIIFGVDRSTEEGQGTEFADALTCGHWVGDNGGQWRIGVINYQYEPRILRDYDWDNAYWSQHMLEEIERYEELIDQMANELLALQSRHLGTRPSDLDAKTISEWEEIFQEWWKEEQRPPEQEAFYRELTYANEWVASQLAYLDVETLEELQRTVGKYTFMSDPWTAACRVIQDYQHGNFRASD
jgi:hypothetical protein